MIILRRAQLSDSDNLYHWRNAPEVRQYSFDSEPIAKEAHVQWLTNTLASSTRHLLIAEENQQPVGVLRFDLLKPTEAEVNIYVCPGLTGNGYGQKILQAGATWVKQNLVDVHKLVARVFPENAASCAVFEKSGFEKVIYVYERVLI